MGPIWAQMEHIQASHGPHVGSYGSHLEPCGSHIGPQEFHMGPIWASCGTHLGPYAPARGLQGLFKTTLGSILGHLGCKFPVFTSPSRVESWASVPDMLTPDHEKSMGKTHQKHGNKAPIAGHRENHPWFGQERAPTMEHGRTDDRARKSNQVSRAGPVSTGARDTLNPNTHGPASK